ncbi:MAG: glycyl-radical enzyme activating protein [Bacteroidales bacterium]|nr:glycyl-radical enzyme activating protein [Bacteroidales bacterium]
MKGIIFDIKRMALHDGPGIRQTVFFKGCPLGCHWCHNPESRSKNVMCLKVFETLNSIEVEDEEIVGREIDSVELMGFIQRDSLIYEESGGGVTFSGGEPLMQPDFLWEVLTLCKKHEIHTCVDTTGYSSWDKIEKIVPFTDLFLYDLKHPDNEKHRHFTGVENIQILKNLSLLDELGKEIWIRIPFIPTINDDEADLLKFLAILAKLKNKPEISLLPYHKIGSHKYTRFQLPNLMHGVEEPSGISVAFARHFFENEGYHVTIGG